MKEYQKRVVEEKIDLDAKIEKIHAFLISAPDTLSSEEYCRMSRQMTAMRKYSEILEERIEAFERIEEFNKKVHEKWQT